MVEIFIASLDETIQRKGVGAKKPLHNYDGHFRIVICLGNARKLGCPEILSAKRLFEKNFNGGKCNFNKHKYEIKEEVEGGWSMKQKKPKGFK